MANNRRITIDIEANDYASSVFRNVTANVSGFGGRVSSAVGGVNSALRNYNNAMRGFNRTMQRVLLEAGRAVYSFTSDAIKQFAKLEEQHAKTMGAMSSNYNFNNPADVVRFQTNSNALMNQAIQYGYNGPNGQGSLYSPQEISAAQTALRKAGISEEDILNTDALSTVIKFAGGAGIDLDKAVEFAVQLGSQFDYTPDMWGEMLDQVVYAANASIIDVDDIMASMKYAGNMAAGYDVPLADVLAALDVMGQSGLKGSQAGTGIQAIFARGMSPTGVTTAGKPPTEHVEDVYNGFASRVVDENGMFKGLGNFTDILEDATFDLSDQEKAWFYKKLFGMFQQKAGLALTGADPEKGEMSYQDYVDAIIEHAAGTNDKIYEVALETTYGSLESVENAWLAFKTEFGKDLSPVTKAVARQLRNAMVNKEYDFDTDDIRTAVEEAGKLISQDFGETLGNAVTNAGNLLADAIDIGAAETPMITSAFDALVKLLNGDVTGAFESLKQGVSDTNDNIDDLPPELQDTARAIEHLILIFEGLFALNIVTRVAQFLTTIGLLVSQLSGGVGKFIGWITGKTNQSLNSTVTSTNTTMTTNSVGSMYVSGNVMTMNVNSIPALTASNVANATIASMMANTTTMTVYASVVNVIGGGGLGNGSGGLPSGGGGTPLLGGGGGLPALGGGSWLPALAAGGGGLAIGSGLVGSGALALPGASAPLMLPEAVGAAGAASAIDTAGATTLYVLGGKAYTAGQLAKLAGLGALKVAGAAALSYAAISTLGSPGLLWSEDKRVNEDSAGIDRTVAEIAAGKRSDIHGLFQQGKIQTLDDYDLYGPGSGYYWARNHPESADNGGSLTNQELLEREVRGRFDARAEMMNLYKSLEGATMLIEAMNAELAANNELSEDFWTKALTFTGSNGYTYTGSNDDAIELLRAIFPNFDSNYSGSGSYSDRFADTALSNFVEKYIGDADLSQLPQILEQASTSVISLSDAVNMLLDNGKIDVLSLGQGPLSKEGAHDYIMGLLGSTQGTASNQELVDAIVGGINGIDPTINVDVKNPVPRVNVDVRVNVDRSGNVTKNVITNYSDISSWVLRDAARFGSRTATDR